MGVIRRRVPWAQYSSSFAGVDRSNAIGRDVRAAILPINGQWIDVANGIVGDAQGGAVIQNGPARYGPFTDFDGANDVIDMGVDYAGSIVPGMGVTSGGEHSAVVFTEVRFVDGEAGTLFSMRDGSTTNVQFFFE